MKVAGVKRQAGRQFRWPALLALMLNLVACDFPRDANGTLERVRSEGLLRVGFSEKPPWVIAAGGEPNGIEPRLIRAWAAQLPAQIEWVRGSESALIEALEQGRIQVMIGGHVRTSPWLKRAGTTQPYLRASVIVAVPPGAPTPVSKSELKGNPVAHAASRPDIAALIADFGGEPRAGTDLRGKAAAVYEFETGRLGLTPTKIVLREEEHVMMVSSGESGFLLELDRFLLGNGRRIALTDEPS